jgi:dolichyl-diphosphooligosaccharide---protein glycosyltransferase
MLVCSLMGLCPQPYSPGLWKSYSIFYVIGTLGAIQFPVVGYTPLKSLEQLAPLFLFLWMQLVHICQMYKAKNPEVSEKKLWDFYILIHMAAAVLGAVVLFGIMPEGYLGPLSSRVRGLFVQHTRTGNPLVDSVAEHQATRDEMYYQYFHVVCYLGPVGFGSLFFGRSYSQIFMITYTAVAMYFSRKMIRLILILGPASSVVGGMALELILGWAFSQLTLPGRNSPSMFSIFIMYTEYGTCNLSNSSCPIHIRSLPSQVDFFYFFFTAYPPR